jgi:hypothetical protein
MVMLYPINSAYCIGAPTWIDFSAFVAFFAWYFLPGYLEEDTHLVT